MSVVILLNKDLALFLSLRPIVTGRERMVIALSSTVMRREGPRETTRTHAQGKDSCLPLPDDGVFENSAPRRRPIDCKLN
jgi:hypothetical protein